MRLATLRSPSLWIAQIALAALFLFAGATKLVMSAQALAASSTLPIGFLRFIGFCELLGALGLVLPGALRIRSELTPIAAGALVVVMSGAVGATLQGFGANAAILPGVTGLLCALVAVGRRGWLTAPPRARRSGAVLATASHA